MFLESTSHLQAIISFWNLRFLTDLWTFEGQAGAASKVRPEPWEFEACGKFSDCVQGAVGRSHPPTWTVDNCGDEVPQFQCVHLPAKLQHCNKFSFFDKKRTDEQVRKFLHFLSYTFPISEAEDRFDHHKVHTAPRPRRTRWPWKCALLGVVWWILQRNWQNFRHRYSACPSWHYTWWLDIATWWRWLRFDAVPWWGFRRSLWQPTYPEILGGHCQHRSTCSNTCSTQGEREGKGESTCIPASTQDTCWTAKCSPFLTCKHITLLLLYFSPLSRFGFTLNAECRKF